MQTLNNFKQLLIAKDVARTTTADTTIASPSTLADGEVAVVDSTNRVLAANTLGLADLPYVRIVQGQGSTKPLIMSPPIPKTAEARAKTYVAVTQQVSYIGYNSATSGVGSFDAVTNMGLASPMIRTTFKSMYYQYADKLMEAIAGYKPTSSDTISTFVDKSTLALTNEVKRYVYVPYKVERQNSGGNGAQVLGASAVFTKGSTLVTCTNLGTLAVGDYLKVGAYNSNATAIYKVTSLTAGVSFTIDQAFQSTSGTFTHTTGATSATKVTVATTTGTAGAGWGIKLTGLNQTSFRENVYRQETQKWITTVQNMGSTTVSDYTKPTEGHGTYEQIATEEVFFLFSEGFADNASIQIPNVEYRKNAVSTGTYASLEIYWKDKINNTTNIADTGASWKQVKIAADNDGSNEFIADSCFYDVDADANNAAIYNVIDTYLTTGITLQGTFTGA